jgi:hypothetical protein
MLPLVLTHVYLPLEEDSWFFFPNVDPIDVKQHGSFGGRINGQKRFKGSSTNEKRKMDLEDHGLGFLFLVNHFHMVVFWQIESRESFLVLAIDHCFGLEIDAKSL